MKGKLVRVISIFVGILLASALLNGSRVMFLDWYAFPETFSGLP
ncbi:hypothetical protein [Erwinia sp. CGal63]